ncbi:MAG: hypothetical protein ABIJ35_12035 [Acidobacteriota bacterium]
MKKVITHTLIAGLMLSLIVPALSAQEAEQAKRGMIPKEVKVVFEAGQSRLDIPFQIIKNIYLPTPQNLHAVFLMEIKNGDLGYAPMVASTVDLGVETDAQSSFESTPSQLQSKGHAFLQFNKVKDGSIGELVKEVYIPYNFQVDGSSYDPEKTDFYSMGYPLPPGEYRLAFALCTPNLEKIGAQFFDFTIPDPMSFTKELDTTPIFFAKNIKRIAQPETTVEMHRGNFVYSVLEIEPNLNNLFAPTDTLDIFFYIFGTRPTPEGKYDIEVSYEVNQDDKVIIRYEAQKYLRGPIVSQPLPLKVTKKVITKDEKGEIVSEELKQSDIEPGEYILKMTIKDHISGNSTEKTVEFTVK